MEATCSLSVARRSLELESQSLCLFARFLLLLRQLVAVPWLRPLSWTAPRVPWGQPHPGGQERLLRDSRGNCGAAFQEPARKALLPLQTSSCAHLGLSCPPAPPITSSVPCRRQSRAGWPGNGGSDLVEKPQAAQRTREPWLPQRVLRAAQEGH